jgi:hypothetical protein
LGKVGSVGSVVNFKSNDGSDDVPDEASGLRKTNQFDLAQSIACGKI